MTKINILINVCSYYLCNLVLDILKYKRNQIFHNIYIKVDDVKATSEYNVHSKINITIKLSISKLIMIIS